MKVQTYIHKDKAFARYSNEDMDAPAPTQAITDLLLDRLMVFFTHRYLNTAQFRLLHNPELRQDYTTKVLGWMKRKPNRFLNWPVGQKRSDRAKYDADTLTISQKGVDILLHHGRITAEQADLWIALRKKENVHEFFHDAAASWLTWSAHLACKQAGLKYIPWYEILTHISCPATTRSSKSPYRVPTQSEEAKSKNSTDNDSKYKDIIPDELFGIFGDEPTFYFVEHDNSTEPQNTVIRQKLLAYIQVLQNRTFETHFGFTYAEVLFVTLGHGRLNNLANNILKTAPDHAGLFKLMAVPELGWQYKRPLDINILTQKWLNPHLREVPLFS